jgi:hypothetical protein
LDHCICPASLYDGPDAILLVVRQELAKLDPRAPEHTKQACGLVAYPPPTALATLTARPAGRAVGIGRAEEISGEAPEPFEPSVGV